MSTVLDLKNPPERPEEDEDLGPEDQEEELSVLGILPQALTWEASRVVSGAMHRRRWIVGAVVLAIGAVIAIWQGSWMTFFIVVTGLAAWELGERFIHPNRISVDHHGLTVDGRRYAHAELTSFDVYRMPDQSYELSVATKHWHIPHLRLPLGEQDPQAVFDVMAQFVPNEPHALPFIDYWLRK